ncbi:MAG TPA: glycoside hydrolase family 18 protein [Cytophagaceae bacterium]
MKKIISLLFVPLLLIITTSFQNSAPSQSMKKYKIIGYVAGWVDVSKMKIDVSKLTHINYAFTSLDEFGLVKPATQRDVENLKYLNSLKQENKDLKILISIGGWGADFFSNAALNEKSRLQFAKSAVSYMKENNLDGVDIDWEYPGQPGGGNIFRAKDKENFTLMLKQLREELDKQSKLDGRTNENAYLLTIATGGDQEYLKHTELGIAHQYLDFINIMTYDLYHGNDRVTGHHTPLYPSKIGKQERNSSADAVRGHIEAGVPAHKIVLGLAFYGRGWEQVKNVDNGLFQPASGKHITLSYDSLQSTYINKNGYVRLWDEDAKAPYLWNADSRTFITYADEESFIYKAEYVKSQGLGGVMFWEYSQNVRDGVLLNKIYEELNK